MNTKLVSALRSPMTGDNRRMVLRMMSQANTDRSPLMAHIQDQKFVLKVSNLGVSYLETAIAKTSRMGWGGLVEADEAGRGLQRLLANDAILPYTQTIMLISAALMKE